MGAWRALVACLVLVAAAGCIQPQDEPGSEDTDDPRTGVPETGAPCTPPTPPPSTPGAGPGQSGVTNQPGSFTYGGQAAAKTATEVYLWENPSRAAQITWGGQMATGMLKLTVVDACGLQVQEGEQNGPSQGGSVQGTNEGTPGAWTLTFEFTAYTGQMGMTITSA